MWQERESCAARSPGSLWRRAKTRLATQRPSPSPASVQGTNDRPGGGTGVQKGPEGLGEPLRQVLPAAPCSQTASRTTCQPAGRWDSVPPPPRPRIEHGAREAHWAGAAVPSACTAPGHSGPTEPAAQGPAMRALHQQQGLHTAGSPEPAAGPPASRRLWATKVRLAPACCTPTPSLAGARAWTPCPSPSLQPQSPCPRRRALRKPRSGPSAVSAGPEGLRDVCGVTVET